MIPENSEDTDGAVEHQQTHDVAQCRRFTTRPGSLQVHTAAFEIARRKGARRLTCGHTANIMKLTDGLFPETFYEVTRSYPELRADELIVDDMAMKLTTEPQAFDVVVLLSGAMMLRGLSCFSPPPASRPRPAPRCGPCTAPSTSPPRRPGPAPPTSPPPSWPTCRRPRQWPASATTSARASSSPPGRPSSA
ncbi:MAG: hypothetical protein JNM72_21275 [Deltaproteobacteria bacterium]|nr:hypothetical protein [Deltaproteobacteria bacterium]